ncbi:MAG: glutathione S-transferase [Cyanobacteria bacterium J06621_11]
MATIFGGLLATNPVKAVPVAADVESVEYSLEEEIPEEILRTEIITEARSPLTGEPLSAAEYAQLQSELADSAGTPLVSDDLRYLIFLLQFRRAVKPIIPFL